MKQIGTVAFVQVQRASLKVGHRPHSHYDPSPLFTVDRLALAPEGVTGHMMDGTVFADVHNATHPNSRNTGTNGISIGFTAHYAHMRTLYGTHLTDGSAGENIMVTNDRIVTEDDLKNGVFFRSPDGRVTAMRLNKCMAPCIEFSHFANRSAERLPAEVLQATLQSLHHGIRGFEIAPVASIPSLMVQAGDEVLIP